MRNANRKFGAGMRDPVPPDQGSIHHLSKTLRLRRPRLAYEGDVPMPFRVLDSSPAQGCIDPVPTNHTRDDISRELDKADRAYGLRFESTADLGLAAAG
jgi:hypothetical protein